MSRKTQSVLIIILVGLITLISSLVILQMRYDSAVAQTRKNLKQIGTALHQYHEKYSTFPPAYELGPDGKPWHSWRVLLLPFLGEESLYAKYHFDEPWNGPRNKALQAERPKFFSSGLQKFNSKNVATYLGVVSRRTMWPAYFSVSIGDVTDGPGNTIFLVEHESSDVIWTEPRDLREREALAFLKPEEKGSTAHSSSKKMSVLLVDGNVRRISDWIGRDLFLSLLTPQFRSSAVREWPIDLLADDRDATSNLPDVVDASNFPKTRILTAPNETVLADQTLVYCATVQLAWDQLRPKQNLPVDATDPPASVAWMNEHPFPVDALAEDAYFAGVSRLDDEKSSILFKAFRRKFPDAPQEILNSPPELPGCRILAYLQQSMPFVDVLEVFDQPLKFKFESETVAAHSFGSPSHFGEGGELSVLENTVSIRDYISDDDFIVVLQTKSNAGDEIILAKLKPASTVQATWEQVLLRLPTAVDQSHLRSVDQLQIPILSFGIVAQFQELLGLGLPTPKKPLRYVEDARQTIRFRLDQHGAELISETQMIVGDDGGEPSIPKTKFEPRKLIFDRPFLLALKQRSADVPYLLAWIGNADLIERAK